MVMITCHMPCIKIWQEEQYRDHNTSTLPNNILKRLLWMIWIYIITHGWKILSYVVIMFRNIFLAFNKILTRYPRTVRNPLIGPSGLCAHKRCACAGRCSGHYSSFSFSCFFFLSFHLRFSQKRFAYNFEFLHAFLSNKKIRYSPKKMGGTLPSLPKSSFLGGQQAECVRYG